MKKLIITSVLGLCSSGLLFAQSSNGQERIEWSSSTSSVERSETMGPAWTHDVDSTVVPVNSESEEVAYDALRGEIKTLSHYLQTAKDADPQLKEIKDRSQIVLVTKEKGFLGIGETERVYLIKQHPNMKDTEGNFSPSEMLTYEDVGVLTLESTENTVAEVRHEGEFEVVGTIVERDGLDEIQVVYAVPVYSSYKG